MRSLQSHHITDIYVLVEDQLLQEVPGVKLGRPSALLNSEVVTILLWDLLTEKHKTLRDIYDHTVRYHLGAFPKLPQYANFVAHCHRLVPQLLEVLWSLLATSSEIRFMDSTMLEVCKLVRKDRHKVAKAVAEMGKNHQGWHYGFKLHASINAEGQLCALVLTPANMHDAQMIPYLVNGQTKIAVGDSTYGASVMRRQVWATTGTVIVTPPHYTQTKKLMTKWQHLLLLMRPRIEATFGYLKERLSLVSSFPRSVNGYLLHYVRVLLGYQLMMS